ncbi:TPA: hypothetical protein V0R63_000551 [Streptococcus pneumoniae]|nr:hypothetical protein [Streptococcus pneumoniae]
MKKRINKKASVFLVASVFSFSFATTASVVNAVTAHPAPSPIIDVWEYGVNDNYGYSNYFVSSPSNIGSKSSVTNFWGTVKAQDEKDYGWAYSSATKSWNDVRLNAYWDYYRF